MKILIWVKCTITKDSHAKNKNVLPPRLLCQRQKCTITKGNLYMEKMFDHQKRITWYCNAKVWQIN